jgi:hypothetical protein
MGADCGQVPLVLLIAFRSLILFEIFQYKVKLRNQSREI